MEFAASNRCRVCLQQKNDILPLSNVVRVHDEDVSLCHILVSCCAVEILDDDRKPPTICTQCVQDAETAYKFKQTVERADLTMQYELDNMMNVNIKEEEIDIDEGDDLTMEGDHKTGLMVPIKDELTDSVLKSYNDDLKVEQNTNSIKEFICKICQTYFTNLIKLEHHLENCGCGQIFSNNDTLERTHNKVILKQSKKLESHKCKFCKKSYKFPAEFRYHLMTHTTVKHYLCSYCGNNFNLSHRSECERTHTRHSRTHINKKPDNKASESLKEEQRFGCSVCQKSYRQQKSLINHKCIKTNKKTYKCSQCRKEFVSGYNLRVHTRIHSGEKPYECSECKKRFKQLHHLKSHTFIHTGEKPYECLLCSKRFYRKTHLSSHELFHTGEKAYECSHCSKRFLHQGALNTHVRIHTGEKPYECSHCSKRFTQLSGLNTHKRIHTGEKPYECSHCSKRFAHQNALNSHERCHTGEKPYECSYCSQCFNQKTNLTKHKLIHTGEKPYECSQCSKRFTRQYELTIHERSHTGEKPYKCSHCSKRFNSQSHLNRHERTHTR